jgi:membrane complex biogenesis BtpA family protein
VTAPPRGFGALWPSGSALIGVVHLLPLPGTPRWAGSLDDVLRQAVADARTLSEAGFDGIVVENYGDIPFFAHRVPAETVAALTHAVVRVAEVTSVPLGVNVLRNDAAAAIGIATATEARFVRVNVHTGSMWSDQGLIHGRAADTLRLRAALGIEVAILADVHVKHATPPLGYDLRAAAADAWHRGLADALVVSGAATGRPTSAADLEAVRIAVPEASVLVGSGSTASDVARLLERADGVIVGSAVMVDGRAGGPIDPHRAEAFRRAADTPRS